MASRIDARINASTSQPKAASYESKGPNRAAGQKQPHAVAEGFERATASKKLTLEAAVSSEVPAARSLTPKAELKKDLAFATTVAHRGAYEELPAEYRNDPDFIFAMAERAVTVIDELPREAKDNLEIASKLVELAPFRYGRFTERVRSDPELALRAIDLEKNNALHVSKKLLMQPEFAAQVIEKVPGMMRYLPHSVWKDAGVCAAAAKSPKSAGFIPEKVLKEHPEILEAAAKTIADKGVNRPMRELPKTLLMADGVVGGCLSCSLDNFFDLPRSVREGDPTIKKVLGKILSKPESKITRTDLTEEDLKDPAVARAVARGAGLKGLQDAQLADAELVELALKHHPTQFPLAPPAFRERKDLAIAFLQHVELPERPGPKDVPPITLLAPGLRDEPDVALQALLRDPTNFQYLDASLRADKTLARVACSLDGNQLLYASPELREDKQVVLAAVSEQGTALRFASPRLQQDPDVLAAVPKLHVEEVIELVGGTKAEVALALRAGMGKQAFLALDRLEPYWNENGPLVLDLMRQTERPDLVLPNVSEKLLEDKDFVSKAMKITGLTFAVLPDAFRADPDVIRYAASDPDLYVMKDIHAAGIPKDPKLVAKAIEKEPAVYGRLCEELRCDPQLVMSSVGRDATLVEHLPARVLDDPKLMSELAVANPLVLDYLRPGRRQALVEEFPEVGKARESLENDLKELNIEFRFRFQGNYELLREVIRNRKSNPADDPRPTALIVNPKEDWNGAGEWNSMKDLMPFYRVMYYEVAKDFELMQVMAQATRHKPAELIEITGHGVQRHTAFGSDDPAFFTPDAVSDFALDAPSDLSLFNIPGVREGVANGANVIVRSCSVAKGRSLEMNVANMFALALPNANIWASPAPMNSHIVLGPRGEFIDPGFTNGRTYHVRPRAQ